MRNNLKITKKIILRPTDLDADECILGTHGCSHTCVNFIGSYECQCPIGLKLSNDKRSCIGMKSLFIKRKYMALLAQKISLFKIFFV